MDLDNVVWHALRGPQSSVAEGGEGAARYRSSVAPFAALPDAPSPDAWAALGELVGAGSVAVLFRDEVTVPPGWRDLGRMPTHQMLYERPRAPESDIDGGLQVEDLGIADVDEMLALVDHTEPGPFGVDTIQLGRYIGVRDGGALVAMAGERIHIDGYTEISAVCTEPSHRGRGLATALIARLIRSIHDRGEVPFLHVLHSNESAIRVYEKMGFTTRRNVEAAIVEAP